MEHQHAATGDVEANREYVEAILGLEVWSHSLAKHAHADAHPSHDSPTAHVLATTAHQRRARGRTGPGVHAAHRSTTGRSRSISSSVSRADPTSGREELFVVEPHCVLLARAPLLE